ncbi:MAG: Fic family protein [Patescibacteria group bacterium]
MTSRKWNWQQEDWPDFSYKESDFEAVVEKFQFKLGKLTGGYQYLKRGDGDQLKIQFLSESAYTTSEIEGEFLDRESLKSSIARHFGLYTDGRRIPPAEEGIAQLMINVYETFAQPLNHQTLYKWHAMVVRGRTDIEVVGDYRKHLEPMQIVSGSYSHPKVHFVAPPSRIVKKEMTQFFTWYNQSQDKLPSLIRAGIAHWYFICIHPFEDGNGRLARAVTEKTLSQNLDYPVLIALSQTIVRARKKYYQALEMNNRSNNITTWLMYFCDLVLEAVDKSQELLDFLIKKTQFFDIHMSLMNERQAKVIKRVFEEGPWGFKGGLSAKNYLSITKTSRATTTRDLAELVKNNILRKEGVGKGTRYYLKCE